jgi:4-diphosphocytidyl-2C-methyl-D-erythritol kinase
VKEKVRATLGRAPILSGSGGAYFLLEASEAAARSAAERLKEARPELDVRATSSYRGASAYRGAT